MLPATSPILHRPLLARWHACLGLDATVKRPCKLTAATLTCSPPGNSNAWQNRASKASQPGPRAVSSAAQPRQQQQQSKPASTTAEKAGQGPGLLSDADFEAQLALLDKTRGGPGQIRKQVEARVQAQVQQWQHKQHDEQRPSKSAATGPKAGIASAPVEQLKGTQVPRKRIGAPGTATRSPPAPGRKGKVNKDPALAPQRLSKVVAAAGVASRRAAEELIFEGRVKLNGQVVTVPQTMVTINRDEVLVDGKRLLMRVPSKYYFALNKPKGYICSNVASKEIGAQSRLVISLLDEWMERVWKREHPHPNAIPPRLFTVGRLDVQSTGLILVTNDGAWAQEVSHPSSGLNKEYIATTDQPITKRQLEVIAAGCVVDGAFVQPVAVAAEDSDPRVRNRLRIIIAEGRNREVRVLVSNAGLEVVGLKRVRIGGLRLPRDLGLGQFRQLRAHEMKRVTDKGAQNNPYA